MILVSGELVTQAIAANAQIAVAVSKRDGDVYTALRAENGQGGLLGTICPIRAEEDRLQSLEPTSESDCILITVCTDSSAENAAPDERLPEVKGYAWRGDGWLADVVRIVPARGRIFSRIQGLLETSVLAGKRVLLKGLGSVGATVARLLAQSGVTMFDIMDHDRIEVANPMRHEVGLSQVGRYKTNFVRDLIHDKNPYAEVRCHGMKLCSGTLEATRQLVRDASLIIDTGDEREGKLLMNRLAIEEHKPVIFAGCFRRAHGGQVLRVRPHVSLCYQCFVRMLPDEAADQEVSNADQLVEAAYADRPIDPSLIQPGLRLDIEPICHMTVKLAIQELLVGEDVRALNSLHDDLTAPWWLWLNRREAGTQYEHLAPLGSAGDGLRILSWYGIDADRDPHCPACGDFAELLAAEGGIELSPEDLATVASTA